jgi:hypothetical protein
MSMQAQAAKRRASAQEKPAAAIRASVSFPPMLYQTLEAIARSKKVSVAWVIRDAAEKYVADQWPLLGGPQ